MRHHLCIPSNALKAMARGVAQMSSHVQARTRVKDARRFAVVEEHALKCSLQSVVGPPYIWLSVIGLQAVEVRMLEIIKGLAVACCTDSSTGWYRATQSCVCADRVAGLVEKSRNAT